LNEEGHEFSNIAVKIRFEGFETHSRQKALASPSRSLEILIKDSEKLLSEFKNSGKKVRLVGVRVSRLRKVSSEQASLLEWSGSL
jgi:nucleotidyltransferase/DNA polymerase involved in DNA repair